MDVISAILAKLRRMEWLDSYIRRRDYRPALLWQASEVMYGQLVHYRNLEEEQHHAVLLPVDRHVIIAGPPCSGKTHVLLHRAHFLHHAHQIPMHRMLIMVTGKAQEDDLRPHLHAFGLDGKMVVFFNNWCRQEYVKEISRTLPRLESTTRLDLVAMQDAVLKNLRLTSQGCRYDALLVDAGEDLPLIAYDIIMQIARHATVCMQHVMPVGKAASMKDVNTVLGLQARTHELQHTYIKHVNSLLLAAKSLPDKTERLAFLSQNIASAGNGVPEAYLFDRFKAEERAVVALVQESMERGETIGVLFFSKHTLRRFARRLREAQVPFETLRDRRGSIIEHIASIKFDNRLPKLLTYHGAKGLRFDTIIMPHLRDIPFTRANSSIIHNFMVLGVSRAVNNVYLSAKSSTKFAPLLSMLELQEEGRLEVSNRKQPYVKIEPLQSLDKLLRGRTLRNDRKTASEPKAKERPLRGSRRRTRKKARAVQR